MKKAVKDAIVSIRPLNEALALKAKAHLDDLTKPRGSLGLLETFAQRLYIVNNGKSPRVDPARIYTVAGDHGVAAEGVSLFPQEVTRQMVFNFLNGGAGINVLCRTSGIDLKVVDAGCAGDEFPDHPNLVNARIAPGTGNIAVTAAMSEKNCRKALELGIELADQAVKDGIACLGTGEMGIANTTPATALYSAFLGIDPQEITGPGTGLDAKGVSMKAGVIAKALRTHSAVVESKDPLRILAALGGYEIAALAGLVIGAAANAIPVVVDGFISTAAYVSAWKICPKVADYAFFAHGSAEPGHKKILECIGATPMLDLKMRLGEGTGAALAIFILRSAAAIFNDMATFSGAGVSGGN